jgi:hypothetical protein
VNRVLMRCVMLATVSCGIAHAGAGAQAVERPMTAAELPARLAPGTRQAIMHLGDSLRTVGLPDAPLYAKAAEGVLKGAADARILVVLRSLARELGDARSSLGSGATEAELVAGASALHVGASPAMLRQLRETHVSAAGEATSLATPLVALADLLARRVPAAAAAAAIDSLVARGAPSDDFAALRAAVERDIDAGRAPEASVVQRTQGLLRNIEGRRRTP